MSSSKPAECRFDKIAMDRSLDLRMRLVGVFRRIEYVGASLIYGLGRDRIAIPMLSDTSRSPVIAVEPSYRAIAWSRDLDWAENVMPPLAECEIGRGTTLPSAVIKILFWTYS
ncbi:hypothetical protein E3T26_12655 [Cryobacterium sp. TMT1-21]|uniref:hypothetical protein n=1 Tax=unclassified Cryobacterium TaxID=2649013 RepID=UPI00106D076F|nr:MULTISPECIES: hypothetical protein [unclassified Cryobacterium]TFD11525.1 hypothetical protein E3T26_12655 [Cryobacterium sp. TMT1-21]TFD13132.1 hypothetical protein E3T42_14260 [Cryobacterium sp. TMT4-10]